MLILCRLLLTVPGHDIYYIVNKRSDRQYNIPKYYIGDQYNIPEYYIGDQYNTSDPTHVVSSFILHSTEVTKNA